jgi:hypothetical protein
MKIQKIHIYSQGVVTERAVPAAIADQAISKLQRQGYTCWKVGTPQD